MANAYTGATYMLGADLAGDTEVGAQLLPSMFERVDRPLTVDEDLARAAIARQEAVVRVEAQVAQKLRLGERELARRARRRQ